MSKLFETRFKYVVLIISLAFLILSIYYFKNHVFEIGLKPYNNISSKKMISEEEFILHVNKPSRVLLLHNAKIGAGYVEFKITREDGQLIDEYRLTKDRLINRVYNLDKGIYQCIFKRDVERNKEKVRFYYDKRFVSQKYVKDDWESQH